MQSTDAWTPWLATGYLLVCNHECPPIAHQHHKNDTSSYTHTLLLCRLVSCCRRQQQGRGAAAASSASSAVDARQAAGVPQIAGIRSTVRAKASKLLTTIVHHTAWPQGTC